MKILRIHCFQHVDYEGLGCIKDWCISNGHPITYTRFYKGESLPEPEDFDWLIVMGGPMGIYEEARYSWLSNEKEAIRTAIEHNKTVLGICLGAQLVAGVLGAVVYRNDEKEIGWFDVTRTEQGANESVLNGIQKTFKVFHWHGDTFELPQNARHIFYSKACKNQAFLYKDNVMGLQFHFEVTEESIKTMIENGRPELSGEGSIQSEREILSYLHLIEPINKTMFKVLNNLNK